MSFKKRTLRYLILLALVGVPTGWWSYQYRQTYPYGRSHCCIKQLEGALREYSEKHDGRYPAGESSPEASLSLLYKEGTAPPYLLRGMIVSEGVTRRVLESGHLLDPSSCGWHYTEGLTISDDPKLALLWCKEPLGHFGNREPNGGREIVTVGGWPDYVSGAKWDSFLAEQARLLAQRSERAKTAKPLVTVEILLPNGHYLESGIGQYTMVHESLLGNSSDAGTESGGGMSAKRLTWYQPPTDNGYVERTLSFSNLTSDPVRITFSNGIPDRSNVVFKMHAK